MPDQHHLSPPLPCWGKPAAASSSHMSLGCSNIIPPRMGVSRSLQGAGSPLPLWQAQPSQPPLSFPSPEPQLPWDSPSPGASTAHPTAQSPQPGWREPAPSLLRPLAGLPAGARQAGAQAAQKPTGQHKRESRRASMSHAQL